MAVEPQREVEPSAKHGQRPQLRRVLSLPLITFYGLGTILGAGIYVLVGKIAGVAGLYTPVAFIIAAIVAGFTGFSYAELSARHPLAGGEVVYVEEGLHIRALSLLVGLAIVAAGCVSAATITRGFVGYLNLFVAVPATPVVAGTVIVLGGIAIWGMRESAWAAATATGIELVGLLMVLGVAWPSLGALPERWPELLPMAETAAWSSVMLGAFLAFFAFIGFEDMVNVAEEVHDPVNNLPRAILIALGLATALYILIALVAVLSLPPSVLSASSAPLALVYQESGGKHPEILGIISLFAVINGALVQIIMAARVLYGMAAAQWIPRPFAQIGKRTGTPVIATIVTALLVLLLALALPLVALAKITSGVLLGVFALVNLALIRIKKHHPAPDGVRVYAPWIPWAGLVTSLALLIFQLAAA